jgi:glutamate synthase domain-containing protein 3
VVVPVSDEDGIEAKVKMQRGTGTDNRDTLTMSVSGHDIEEVDEKMQRLYERAEKWAAQFRNIQPDDSRTAHLRDDQRTLADEEARADG